MLPPPAAAEPELLHAVHLAAEPSCAAQPRTPEPVAIRVLTVLVTSAATAGVAVLPSQDLGSNLQSILLYSSAQLACRDLQSLQTDLAKEMLCFSVALSKGSAAKYELQKAIVQLGSIFFASTDASKGNRKEHRRESIAKAWLDDDGQCSIVASISTSYLQAKEVLHTCRPTAPSNEHQADVNH